MATKKLRNVKKKTHYRSFAFGMLSVLGCIFHVNVMIRITNQWMPVGLPGYGDLPLPLNYQKEEISSFDCPVKMYVYDMGFTNRTKNRKKGFNTDSIQKLHYTYIETELANQEHEWFILHKFLWYSKCTVKDPVDADFFLLPLTSPAKNGNVPMVITRIAAHEENERVIKEIERDFNHTLHRRGRKDHIVINLHNTKRGGEMMQRLSDSSVELVKPMVKVVVEIFGYYYFFEKRRQYKGGMVDYDTLLAVPYASNIRDFRGRDVHDGRPYLVSFVTGHLYPEYRVKIFEQCQDARDCLLVDTSNGGGKTYDVYMNSTFFFCPGGDTAVRKGLFDGIASNSIPIVFEEFSFDIAYPAYFPGNPRKYSILLNSTTGIMEQIRAIPTSHIVELKRNIAKIRDRVAYLPRENVRDATWVMMEQLKEYKENGYRFVDKFPANKTVQCVDKTEDQIANRECRFDHDGSG